MCLWFLLFVVTFALVGFPLVICLFAHFTFCEFDFYFWFFILHFLPHPTIADLPHLVDHPLVVCGSHLRLRFIYLPFYLLFLPAVGCAFTVPTFICIVTLLRLLCCGFFYIAVPFALPYVLVVTFFFAVWFLCYVYAFCLFVLLLMALFGLVGCGGSFIYTPPAHFMHYRTAHALRLHYRFRHTITPFTTHTAHYHLRAHTYRGISLRTFARTTHLHFTFVHLPAHTTLLPCRILLLQYYPRYLPTYHTTHHLPPHYRFLLPHTYTHTPLTYLYVAIYHHVLLLFIWDFTFTQPLPPPVRYTIPPRTLRFGWFWFWFDVVLHTPLPLFSSRTLPAPHYHAFTPLLRHRYYYNYLSCIFGLVLVCVRLRLVWFGVWFGVWSLVCIFVLFTFAFYFLGCFRSCCLLFFAGCAVPTNGSLRLRARSAVAARARHAFSPPQRCCYALPLRVRAYIRLPGYVRIPHLRASHTNAYILPAHRCRCCRGLPAPPFVRLAFPRAHRVYYLRCFRACRLHPVRAFVCSYLYTCLPPHRPTRHTPRAYHCHYAPHTFTSYAVPRIVLVPRQLRYCGLFALRQNIYCGLLLLHPNDALTL